MLDVGQPDRRRGRPLGSDSAITQAPRSEGPSGTDVWADGPVVVVCGTGATGKTYLAEKLASVSGLRHLTSHSVRKELKPLVIPATERHRTDAYRDELWLRTYAELGRRAAALRGAIVSATFRRRRDRDAFARGYGGGRAPFFVECWAPRQVVRARALARLREPSRKSGATPEGVELSQREFEPLGEVPAARHLLVRTDRPLEEIVLEVEAGLRRAGRLQQGR
jgi:predicted kinase